MKFEYDTDTKSTYYKETSIIMSHKDELFKHPYSPLNDFAKGGAALTVFCIAGTILISHDLIKHKSYDLLIVFIILMIPYLMLSFLYLKKPTLDFKNDNYERHSKFELTKDGIKEIITLKKIGETYTQEIDCSWDKIQFIRVFNNTVALFFKDTYKPIIFIKKEYKDQLREFLDENGIEVKWLENMTKQQKEKQVAIQEKK